MKSQLWNTTTSQVPLLARYSSPATLPHHTLATTNCIEGRRVARACSLFVFGASP